MPKSRGMSITWRNPRLEKRGRDGVRYWLKKFETILKENLSGARSGREYYLPGGGTYIASAPGEYPAHRPSKPDLGLGELRDSIRVTMKTTANGTEAAIGTDAEHGEILEKKFAEGKKGGRPWLSRAYQENKDWLIEGLERQFRKLD